MFTGLVTDIGEVAANEGGRFTIRTRYSAAGIAIGDSIACDGCCLTVIAVSPEDGGARFVVDASNETLAKTAIGTWAPERPINLERALKAGAEIGGHFVSGHIDGVAKIASMETDGESRRFTIEASEALAKFIAPKGSIALDGVSLTVNEVAGVRFGVNLIPHTLTATALGRKRPGDLVNMEVDMIARYVARLMEFRP